MNKVPSFPIVRESSLPPRLLRLSRSQAFGLQLSLQPRFSRQYSSRSKSTATMTTTTTTTTQQALSAPEVLRLFPDVNPNVIGAGRAAATEGNDLEGYDEEQVRLMEEVCIVIDGNDKPIGSASKKLCHLMSNINQGLLHRAFSVFLFDHGGRLLLQQRASEKITFPDMWTNTCCSHPLGIPGETGSTLDESIMGVKRAAQRKLDHELGIPANQVPIDEFHFLTRIHYVSPSDGKWGEHEIDYILFIQPKTKVTLNVNQNEAQATRWVSQQELKDMFTDAQLKFTPWFKLICQSMLFEWWDHLDSGLDKYLNESDIRRMLEPPTDLSKAV